MASSSNSNPISSVVLGHSRLLRFVSRLSALSGANRSGKSTALRRRSSECTVLHPQFAFDRGEKTRFERRLSAAVLYEALLSRSASSKVHPLVPASQENDCKITNLPSIVLCLKGNDWLMSCQGPSWFETGFKHCWRSGHSH